MKLANASHAILKCIGLQSDATHRADLTKCKDILRLQIGFGLGSLFRKCEKSNGIFRRYSDKSFYKTFGSSDGFANFYSRNLRIFNRFFLLCFLGGRILDCNQKIQKSHYFILAKKYTLQHLKISAVSVFDPMTSFETTITYSKDKRTYIIGQFQGEGFKWFNCKQIKETRKQPIISSFFKDDIE